jgi:hypothetical protein
LIIGLKTLEDRAQQALDATHASDDSDDMEDSDDNDDNDDDIDDIEDTDDDEEDATEGEESGAESIQSAASAELLANSPTIPSPTVKPTSSIAKSPSKSSAMPLLTKPPPPKGPPPFKAGGSGQTEATEQAIPSVATGTAVAAPPTNVSTPKEKPAKATTKDKHDSDGDSNDDECAICMYGGKYVAHHTISYLSEF